MRDKGDWQAVDNLVRVMGLQSGVLPKEQLEGAKYHFIAGWGGYPLVGSPSRIADEIGKLASVGLDGALLSWPRYEEGLTRFIWEIMPLVEQTGLRKAVSGPAETKKRLGEMTMTTMIAARLHEYGEPMRLDRIPIPEPRPTDVLVEVKACGIVPNLARVVANFFATQTPDRKGMPPLPAIFGLDPTGVITKVGDQVRSIRPGDRVYVNPARKCGSCRMCRSGQPLDCPNFTFQGYFGRCQEIMKAYPYGGLCQYITAPAGCAGQAAGQCELRGRRALRLSGHRLRGDEEARRRPGADLPGERHQRHARPECGDAGAGDGRHENSRHRPQRRAAQPRQGAGAATDRGVRGR